MTTRTETDAATIAREAIENVCAGSLDRIPEFYDEQVTQGDRVASRWTLHGTHRGRQVDLHGIVISRIEDGRIIEDHAFSDSLALPRALGLWRSIAVLIDVLRGKVKLPKGAIGG